MMSNLVNIQDEANLIKQLVSDIDSCNKEKIVFFAGHFPLFYEEKGALEAIKYWGEFSLYSLEIACKVGKHALDIGKVVEFVIFVDDHSYETFNKLGVSQVKTRRNKLYKEKSGDKAVLPKAYKDIMKQHGFDESNVIRQNQGKKNRENCLYFSEKILRASTKKISNACAREYAEFFDDPKYFNKNTSCLISFIPNRCQGHICNVALDKELKNLSASHVFMETMVPTASRSALYEIARGVTYRQD